MLTFAHVIIRSKGFGAEQVLSEKVVLGVRKVRLNSRMRKVI